MVDLIGSFIGRSEQKEAIGQSFDIDNWTTEFEQGFPRVDKINPRFRDNYWGQGSQNRPRFKELNEQQDAANVEGYRLIEFFTGRNEKDKSYLLMGLPWMVQLEATLLMNIELMLTEYVNSGGFFGYPWEEYLRTKAREGVGLKFIMLTNRYGRTKKTAWGENLFSIAQLQVPHVDRGKCSYEALRKACGGDTGLSWGEWQARAFVSLPGNTEKRGMPQMVASGPTKAQARQNLEPFLNLTECELRNITYNQLDYDEGERAKDVEKGAKKNFKVYPAFVTVMNREIVPTASAQPNSSQGRNTNSGRQLKKKIKFDLLHAKKPEGWDEQFKDAFRNSRGQLID